MAYRTTDAALAERRVEHCARQRRIDEDAPVSSRRLPAPLRARLGELRARAEPDDQTVGSLSAAEQAVDRYEATLDEALGLSAEMRKWMNPVIPRRREVARWASFALAALIVMGAGVHYLGLTGFMWRALGGQVAQARPDLTAGEAFLGPALLPPEPVEARPAVEVDVSLTEAPAKAPDSEVSDQPDRIR